MSIFNNIWVKRILFDTFYLLLLFHLRRCLIPDLDCTIVLRICRIILSIGYCLGGLAFIITLFHQIKLAITKKSEIGCDHKGIYLDDGFIAWNKINEFKISRDTLLYKSIHVIEKPEDGAQAKPKTIARLFHRSQINEHGPIHEILPDQFNGTAESFVAYLEGEKKRYGKE